MNISGISTLATSSKSELQNLFESISTSLRQQEENIRESFIEGLNKNGNLFGVPDHVRRQIEVWENTFTSAEDRKMVDELKSKILEITSNNESYIREQAEQKTARFQLELAMRAANKSVSGIQQLLSSQ